MLQKATMEVCKDWDQLLPVRECTEWRGVKHASVAEILMGIISYGEC